MERDRIEQQLDLFSDAMPKYVINKPIRLIELFAGIGSQFKALKKLTDKVESYKICEWAYNSILAYNAIHIKDFSDYAKDMSKEQLVESVYGISTDYNVPLTKEQLKKKNIEWLKRAYNNIKATHNLVNVMTAKGKDFENRERNANYSYIGIELQKEYCEISVARIDYALNKYEYDMIQDIKKEEQETGQMSLFDF